MNTPERAPTLSPEQTPQRTPQELLSPDSIEQYRQSQAHALSEKTSFLKGAADRRAEREDFRAHDLPLMHRHYLAQAGVDENDPRYPQYMHLLGQSAIETSNPMGDQWYIQDDNHQTRRDRYVQQYDQLFTPRDPIAGTPDTAPAATASSVDRDPILAEWHTELAGLRDELATLMAKRHGRIAGKGGEEYEAVRARYNDQLIALGKLEKEAYLNDPTKSDEDKKLEVTKYLFDEQAKLHQATTEKLANTPTGKFIGWMTKGKVATRIAKGLALGVGVGIVGAAVGAVAGVAGAAAIGAGVATAATTATRYARGFAMHFGEKGRSMRVLDSDQRTESVQDIDGQSGELIEKINAHKEAITEQELKRGQRKTRMAVGAGVLSIVAGAGLATAAHAAVDSGLFNGNGNRFIGGGAETDGGERPVAPEANTQTPEDARAQAEADKAAAEAEARKNVVPSSDTPAVADAIRDALGGGPSGDTAGAFAGELGATTLTSGGLEGFSNWMEGYTVKSGDSIWSLSEQYLHSHGVTNPSVYQIDAAKDAMLAKLQERGLADANGWLQAGQRISLR